MKKRGNMSIVASLCQDLQFVSDHQDTEAIKQHVGEKAQGYDAFFVEIKDGKYTQVWGIVGTATYLSKLASRLL